MRIVPKRFTCKGFCNTVNQFGRNIVLRVEILNIVDSFKLTREQLNSLAATFLPVIREFYESERGKKMWEEHLREKAKGTTEK